MQGKRVGDFTVVNAVALLYEPEWVRTFNLAEASQHIPVFTFYLFIFLILLCLNDLFQVIYKVANFYCLLLFLLF